MPRRPVVDESDFHSAVYLDDEEEVEIQIVSSSADSSISRVRRATAPVSVLREVMKMLGPSTSGPDRGRRS
jgi:stress-induced morphogen